VNGEKRTKGQVEAAIATAISQFEREFLGRGPKESKAFLVQDLVLVRVRGVLSPAEQRLSREAGGVPLLKQMRTRLIEGARDELVRIVETHGGVPVTAMHTDLSVASGERIFVFVLGENLEGRLAEGPAGP
jgi:uncharacterized protein YbcI